MKRIFAISLILASSILIACGDEDESDSFEYGTLIDPRDNKTYKTIKIGDQEWMAENLDYADSINTPNLKERTKCPEDKEENCLKYGRLYSDFALMDWSECNSDSPCNFPPLPAQGICPPNWHIPTVEEWLKLKENHGEKMVGFVEHPAGTYGYFREEPSFAHFKQTTVIWTIDSTRSCTDIGVKEFTIGGVNFDDVCQKNYTELLTELRNNPDNREAQSYNLTRFRECSKGWIFLSIRCLKD